MLFEDIYTKSETYQKEGWFILEEENSVFGCDADNTIKLDSEEKFSIYHNKEEAKNNIDISAKELSDFVDSIIQDVPDLSEEEVNRGVAKIREKAYPNERVTKLSKNNKSKKITLRVLFIAALITTILFSCVYVVGSSHNISIENGFVTFAKDAVKIVFFGEDKEKHIDVKTLLEDLESHGYKDILLPQILYGYKSSVPVYSKGLEEAGTKDRVEFELSNDSSLYLFKIEKVDSEGLIGNYFTSLENAETILLEDVRIYVFEFDGKVSCIRFVYDEYDCLIQSYVSLTEMINTAQTIIKTEE